MDVIIPLVVEVTLDEFPTVLDVTVEDNTVLYDVAVDAAYIVQPIPQNYGLITWNGSYLTVS